MIVKVLRMAYTPTFVNKEPNRARIGIGGAKYDPGIQKYKGNIAAFNPKTIRNKTEIRTKKI